MIQGTRNIRFLQAKTSQLTHILIVNISSIFANMNKIKFAKTLQNSYDFDTRLKRICVLYLYYKLFADFYYIIIIFFITFFK